MVTNCGNACDYFGIPGDTYCTKKHSPVCDNTCSSCPDNKSTKENKTKSE